MICLFCSRIVIVHFCLRKIVGFDGLTRLLYNCIAHLAWFLLLPSQQCFQMCLRTIFGLIGTWALILIASTDNSTLDSFLGWLGLKHGYSSADLILELCHRLLISIYLLSFSDRIYYSWGASSNAILWFFVQINVLNSLCLELSWNLVQI